MIDLIWDSDTNFRIDWTNDPDLKNCNAEITQQLYALVMGWA